MAANITTITTATTMPTLTRLSFPPEPGTRSMAGFRSAATSCRRRRSLRDAPPTSDPLSPPAGQAQHSTRPGPHDQPPGQQQEPRVAEQLAPVRRLPRIDGAATPEAPAVDREPAGPRLRHPDHEPQQEHRRGDGHGPGGDADEQEQADHDLQ